MHVLVAGCGWLGTSLARALSARGDRVTGVRRGASAAPDLAALGVRLLAVDLAGPGAAAGLPRDIDAIIACQAARGASVEEYRRAYVDANRTLLDHAAACGARAFVYTGSTGVFGQRDGGIVHEDTPLAPASATGEVLAEAEALIKEAARGGPACLIRLSGLYGPGRTGIVERVRAGALALGLDDDAWMNWCHRDDAVGLTLAALDRGRSGAAYHGSDAEPVRRRDVVSWIAARLGIPPPRVGGAPPPGSSASSSGTTGANRRIDSTGTRAELAYALRYPSFREGLAPLLDGAP